MKELLTVQTSPHIRRPGSVPKAMRIVVIALLPAFLYSVYLYGWRSLIITLLCILSCVVGEAMVQRMLGKPVTISDGSALLTGLLLAFNLPPGVPLWIPVIGGVFAIVFAKQLFGGLGYNFINPALAGRAFLMASWPSFMTKEWLSPAGGTLSGIDGISSATPLTLLKNPANFGDAQLIVEQLHRIPTIKNLFFGNIGGCIGETSAFLLLLGGLFLIVTRIIDYRIVVGYFASFMVLILIINPYKFHLLYHLLFHLFSGGLFLGAFFMATDWVTSPITKKGRWIFGIGCGVLTVVIRTWGGYPEGVSYSILLMNVFTPLIDRLTREKVFGQQKKRKEVTA